MFLRLRGCGELHQDTEDSARRVNIPISAHLDPTTMSDIALLEFSPDNVLGFYSRGAQHALVANSSVAPSNDHRRGDIAMCLSGKFNHRHLRTAGECLKFYDSTYTLSKEQSATVSMLHGKEYKPQVPHEAVDECQSSYTAGNGGNMKTNMEKFDDSGVMALVCRHDIPLFMANIDSPGQQQKYAVALIEHQPQSLSFMMLDVSSIGAGSLWSNHQISAYTLAHTMTSFQAMSALDSSLQPPSCMRTGTNGRGLSDCEGVEHLWSSACGRAPVVEATEVDRTDSVLCGMSSYLDRSSPILTLYLAIPKDVVTTSGTILVVGLGGALLRGMEGQGKVAQAVLDECGIPVAELRRQWCLQQESQLSVRALNEPYSNDIRTPGSHSSYSTLFRRPTITSNTKSKFLYASLNVHESFPDLRGVDLEFVRTLLHLHGTSRLTSESEQPAAFLNGIALINMWAGGMNHLEPEAIANLTCTVNGWRSEWAIPLPEPLPTQLAPLRDCAHLMQDVWIAPTTTEVPRWLHDVNARVGIRARLKLDRCQEKRRRLGMEADNICRWFGAGLSAVCVALENPSTYAPGPPSWLNALQPAFPSDIDSGFERGPSPVSGTFPTGGNGVTAAATTTGTIRDTISPTTATTADTIPTTTADTVPVAAAFPLVSAAIPVPSASPTSAAAPIDPFLIRPALTI
ncbi:hypothetical protein Hypma_003347 [Hypsizygus marmoreus]|uniref:Uncharacterized protein n=1 Tax=Hypsizygus marmoreus TaxID=39966 RepID=A0A369J6W5_HYPMA|nr:hypothetical protein Hypma_003347 [Hypsizygus marmoreus]